MTHSGLVTLVAQYGNNLISANILVDILPRLAFMASDLILVCEQKIELAK